VLSETASSSSTWKRSSVLRILWYASLYVVISISTLAQRVSMSVSESSIASSLLALEESSEMRSGTAFNPKAKTASSVKSAEVSSKSRWISFFSAAQCRGLKAGFFKSWIKGMVWRNSASFVFIESQMPHFFISRPSLPTFLLNWPASASMSATSKARNWPVFHASNAAVQSLAKDQICEARSKSRSVSRSSLCSGDSIRKMSRPEVSPVFLSCTSATRC